MATSTCRQTPSFHHPSLAEQPKLHPFSRTQTPANDLSTRNASCILHPNAGNRKSHLLIDRMHPSLLRRPSRVSTYSQNALQRIVFDVERLAGNEPSNALGAWWRGEATLIGPEVLEAADVFEG